MTDSTITAEEFEARLRAVCSGGGPGLPRRQRDVAVILASATLWMETGSLYTESEINGGLERWLSEVCPTVELDAVTLRRELVDRAYLDRDDSGANYSPGPGPPEWRFEDAIADIDPAAVMARAAAEREQRREAFFKRVE